MNTYKQNSLFLCTLATGMLIITQVKIISENNEVFPMISNQLDQKVAKKHADLLNKLLANEYTLYTKTLNFHWNVKGKWFSQLHTFFEKQYEELLEIIDIVAEQVKILGFDTTATLQEFVELKTIQEKPFQVRQDNQMIELLLSGHREVIGQIRSMITEIRNSNNYALENILQDILAKHEKTAWMLKSHLE